MTNADAAQNPVSRLIANANRFARRTPVPLVSTRYDIAITGGLADVSATRTFRNEEADAIEATLTFPLPVNAVLYSLEARIGERTLKALAKARDEARETYEDALDSGKTAVLHEELLKGIHMLSVGNVPAGTEIVVTVRFALALSFLGGRALLRIPTTVGDIYGSSGLPDSDEIVHGGQVTAAALTVTADCGTPVLLGGTLKEGAARVWLDCPINIEVEGFEPRDVVGRTADDRTVALAISPAPDATADLDVGILVDRSGSMASPCALGDGITKHAAVLIGLNESAAELTERDRLTLWEFNENAVAVGTATGSSWRTLITGLRTPDGGTEIGGAIDELLKAGPLTDVLLVTDGKSHALDVHALAGRGVRFTVVLIGDDSLEANVGHLAALTGGEVFIPVDADVAAGVRAALGALRAAQTDTLDTTAGQARLTASRGGARIVATMAEPGEPRTADGSAEASRAVAAYAASLRLPHLDKTEATALAVAEGLVTHLTSLVLVDEEGAAQEGLPATRKIALPSPAGAVSQMVMLRRSALVGGAFQPSAGRPKELVMPTPIDRQRTKSAPTRPRRSAPDADLSSLPQRIDWAGQARRLVVGDLTGLPEADRRLIEAAVLLPVVQGQSRALQIDPVRFVVALLAMAAPGDRYARRIARMIFRGLSEFADPAYDKAARHLGLPKDRHEAAG